MFEGLAREVVNRVQNLRKDSGLKVSDRIRLKLTGSAQIKAAVAANQAYVMGEVLATEIHYEAMALDKALHKAVEQFDIEGETIEIGLDV